MVGGLKALLHSLSARLLGRLLFAIVVVFGAYALVSFRAVSSRWLDGIYNSAIRTGELIKLATHQGMLLNRKEDVHQTIRMIARGPGMAGIRVYDKQGRIIFSSDQREIGRQVDRQAEACVICHDKAEPLHKVPGDSRMRVFRALDGARVLGVVSSIENEPECATAGCHAHPPEQSILGVLDVRMSMASVDGAVATARRQLLWTTLAMVLLIGGGVVLFVYRLVRRPVRQLYQGTRRIARGDLTTRIDVTTRDELGQLAGSFNRMTEDLARARAELTEWSEKLEEKVTQKTEQLGRVERQVLHMDKMASLGKLAATVAHELNNPLSGILTYAKLVERDLKDESLSAQSQEEVPRFLSLIQKESSRCGEIVKNLLLFARHSGADFAPHHVNELVGRAMMLVHHHLEMKSIKASTSPLDGDDVILCDGNQIAQALVALLINAVEAMSNVTAGTLTVGASAKNGTVEIRVVDTGSGIAPELLPRIFEPFFSTKSQESGVGLGLAVVYGIVQRHGGTIDVSSEVGKGTCVSMRLPRRPPVEERRGPVATADTVARH